MKAKAVWKWKNKEQKRRMEEKVTRDNCGEKLRLVRAISDISRRDLAEALRVPESTIYRIERGQRNHATSL